MDPLNSTNQSPQPRLPDQNSNANPFGQSYSHQQPSVQPAPQQWQERPPVMGQPTAQPISSQPPQQSFPPTAGDPYGVDSSNIGTNQPSPAQFSANQSNEQQASYQQPQPAAPQQPMYQESALLPGMMKPQPEEVLIEWQAESRPFLQRRRKHFTTVGLICVLIAMILFFAGQILPVAVILAVFFLYYVLNSTPPGMITHKFTTYGVRIEDNLYYWEELGRFWFTEKFGKQVLNIEIDRYPFRLALLLGDINKDDMQALLSEVLLFQVPPPTTYEKVAKWFEEKLPIDMDAN